MAGILQHLRSSTLDKRPNPGSMVDGQVAINYASGSPGLFFKDNAGALVKVGPVHVGATAPNVSPASGGTAGNSLGEQWLDTSGGSYVMKIWDGSAWRTEAGEFVNATGDIMTGALGMPPASAGSPTIYFSGDTDTGLYSPGANQLAITTSGTGRLFVNADGSINLGSTGVTASPTVWSASSPTLSYSDGTNSAYTGLIGTQLRLLNLAAGGKTLIQSEQDIEIKTTGGHPIIAYTANAERLRITSDGNLIQYSTTTLERQHRQQTSSAYTATNIKSVLEGAAGYLTFDTGTNWTNGNAVERLRITSDGKVGIGTSSPPWLLSVRQDTGGITAGNYPAIQINNANAAGYAALYLNDDTAQAGLETKRDTGHLAFYAAQFERARIDSSGRLLVGTSSARTKWFNLTLTGPLIQTESNSNQMGVSSTYTANDTSGPIIALGKTRGSLYEVVSSGDDAGVITFQGGDGAEMVEAARITAQIDGTPGANDMPGRLVFSTTADGASSPTERIRIKSDGVTSFGQGATGPGSGVAGTLINAGDGGILITNNTSPFLRCYTLNAGFPDALQIANNGNVTNANNSYGAISDIKLKENIVDANSQWSDIKALQVRNYNLKEGQTHTQIGLVAQEVELVSPGLVSESPDRDAEGNDLGTTTKSVNYSVLYMKAVKALQEAMERIEVLEQRLTDAGIA